MHHSDGSCRENAKPRLMLPTSLLCERKFFIPGRCIRNRPQVPNRASGNLEIPDRRSRRPE
jgi:hypothetical protein